MNKNEIKTMEDKIIRRNINVSVQSSQYSTEVNKIIDSWEHLGLSISTQACESIILAQKVASSPTLLSVMKLYDLISQILCLNPAGNNDKNLEEIISSVIKINGNGLTDIINNQFSN